MTFPTERRGFTLMELLLVVGIIAIIISIVIVLRNPAQQLANVRDSQRKSDVNTLVQAMVQYAEDHFDKFPDVVPVGTPKEICTTKSADCDAGGVNLSVLVGTYMEKIPFDPNTPASATGTDYLVVRSADNTHITVSAPNAETQEISATR